MAGESKIIATTEDFDEEQGRLRLMNNIGYAYDETNNWQACRAYYAAIMVGIELGEEQWTSNFCRFETMLPKGGPKWVSNAGSRTWCFVRNINAIIVNSKHHILDNTRMSREK